MWVGFADAEPRVELRRFSLVKPEATAKAWQVLKMPFCVVNDVDDFVKWYVSGGHALVEKGLAEQLLPESFKPSPTVQLGKLGFTGTRDLPDDVFKGAPSRKQRMKILKRDRFRCRICGRSPDNHVDIELHVHHIRPSCIGGLTHEENLITLCDTCHKGLDPHFEWSLYDLVAEDRNEDFVERQRREYLEDVQRYRDVRRTSLESE